jgi:hypothetical protein
MVFRSLENKDGCSGDIMAMDKDTSLLVLGILLGAGVSTLYDMFKSSLPDWFSLLQTLPETLTFALAFVFSTVIFVLAFAVLKPKQKTTA